MSLTFSKEDLYFFDTGTHTGLHHILGAHVLKPEHRWGTRFATWAPAARAVHLIGDFNHWTRGQHVLERVPGTNIWATFVKGIKKGAHYKFAIELSNGQWVEKADPFARWAELAPRTASVVWHDDHKWRDDVWMKSRHATQAMDKAMNVYEVHPGSWRRGENGEWLGWRALAQELGDYMLEMGFTHLELLPVMEHPFYGSWGYQSTGYFAPSSRYGTPKDFKWFVDQMHQRGIGVLLDWVPSHFPEDPHGLALFDGTHLFEHPDPRRGFHPDWKSCIFNYDSPQVRSFLISSAMFWLEEFHVDGIRVDAVASMLYLDYSRGDGEWLPNDEGGRENKGAIELLKQLNSAVYRKFPDVHMIAEESTAWSGVSRPVDHGGLGFGMKWDMGWMHDTLMYFSKDPIHRKHHHNQLTFRSVYAHSENFMLAISHDEVVHGKGSLLRKMSGDMWQKFANVRALAGYTHALPGKNLIFMGCEFGVWEEWNHDAQLNWSALDERANEGLSTWFKTLNHLTKESLALTQYDFEPRGFEWIHGDDAQNSVLCFLRHGDQESVMVVCNLTPVPRENYMIGAAPKSRWRILLSSDETRFGGSGFEVSQGPMVVAQAVPHHGQDASLVLDLPPLSVLFLERVVEE